MQTAPRPEPPGQEASAREGRVARGLGDARPSTRPGDRGACSSAALLLTDPHPLQPVSSLLCASASSCAWPGIAAELLHVKTSLRASKRTAGCQRSERLTSPQSSLRYLKISRVSSCLLFRANLHGGTWLTLYFPDRMLRKRETKALPR